MARDDLSPGGRVAIGIAMAALGLGILALSAPAIDRALMVTGFALACDWIAFGSGERHFGGGISVGIVTVPVQSATLGRVVFGAFGVVCDVIAVAAWWLVYRTRA